MNNLQDVVYGIVGLGIMGGSVAKAIRANVLDMPEARGKIFACDALPSTLDAAVRDGVIRMRRSNLLKRTETILKAHRSSPT